MTVQALAAQIGTSLGYETFEGMIIHVLVGVHGAEALFARGELGCAAA